MPAPRYDIIGIGNAIVDVIARAEDDFLVAHGMHKGSMALIEEARAEKIYFEELMKTEDAHEGINAFLEKRPPVWKGK